MTLGERLKKISKRFPGKTALIFEGRRYRYRELDEKTDSFASGLKSIGVEMGDRVAILLPNRPEFAIAYFGTVKAGAAAVPINTFLAPPEIEFILADSGAKCLVCDISFAEKISGLKLGAKVVSVGGGIPGATAFESLFKHNEKVSVAVTPDDPAAILYTSGTTGRPKGAVLTHKNLLSNADSAAGMFRVDSRDRMLLFLPMFHSFTFLVCLLLPLSIGARVYVLSSVKPFSRVIKAVLFGRASFFVAIPPVYNLLSYKRFPRFIFWLLRLRLCVSGAAPLSGEVLGRWAKNYPIPLLEGYGLTEAAPVVSCNPLDGERKAGSVGIPIPGVEVKVVDQEEAELPPGQVGELIVKGPNVMRGYWNNEAATRETIKGGWLFTGDLGYKDRDGYIFIVDRKKDLIIHKGLNIYPREVEEVIYQHPAVRQAAVVGIKEGGHGEIPKAFVSLNEGAELTERELKVFLKGRLAAYKIPRQVEILPELPMTPTGKVLKRALKG